MAEPYPHEVLLPPQGADLHVLLIEDEPGDARLIRAALRGNTVQRVQDVWVESLAAAEVQLKARRFDVALLDLQLPDSSGLATVERLRERAASLPIIVLTGDEESELALQVIEAGAQDYLVKGGFNPDGLLRAIRYAIGRMRMTASLRASEARFREEAARTQTILDSVIDGIITIDRHGVVSSFNRAAETIFGYSADEVVGHNISRLMPEPHRSRHDDYLTNYQTTGEARIIGSGREVEGMRRDGSLFPLELSVSEIRREGEVVYIGVVRDITERKRVERMKNEFISTVSHELRTPLTSISGSLGLLAANALGELPEKAREMVAIAHSNSQRLNHLINDLLDMEKVVAGKMRFDMQVMALQPIVRQALEANRAYAERYAVSFQLQAEPQPLSVRIDEHRLLQVLANLLSNAAKFSPHGGVVEVTVSREGEQARVAVVDHGEGVAPDFRQRIFQKFSQADSSDTRSKGGTGLGLVISRELIEHMGGRIDYHSLPGEGATFFFDLPLLADEAEAVVPQPLCGEQADVVRLLLVAGERAVAEALQARLGDATVEIVNSGAAALRRVESGNYAAVVSTVVLPDMSGPALVRRLRAAGDTAPPLLLVDARRQGGEVVVAGATPILDWLDKPINSQRLERVVKPSDMAGRFGGRPLVLHVEDDPDLHQIVRAMGGGAADYKVAASLEQARAALALMRFSLVILDLALPDGSGWELLGDLQACDEPPGLVVLTAAEPGPDQAGRLQRVLAGLPDRLQPTLEQILRRGVET